MCLREGLGAYARSARALEQNAAVPASADATRGRWTAARIAQRAGLLAGRTGLPVNVLESASRISAREHPLGPICSGIKYNNTCERLLCDARRADAIGASGRRPRKGVLALHTVCDGSCHDLTAAGHMQPGTPAAIRKRSTAFKPSPWLKPAPSQTPGYHHASSPNC